MTSSLHPVQRLVLAEELVRRRRADEHRRHVSSQRAARIDPNPHQVDAVLFALARLPDGGCILADEVGLGKTIEAGLVIAQLLAEGARRILVVTPKALLGQWKQELFTLFAIDAREVDRSTPALDGPGVFLATRDFVGGETGAGLLAASERFDLCVIDEAHEIFAGIYRRFDRHGALRDESSQARMAFRVSQAMRNSGTPVLLLTATPIQNSLLELWGLVHYVDPTGTLLGDLSTFRQVFCPTDERVLAPGQEHELRRRLGSVLQRTLRRQAQEFMRDPFMGRQPALFPYQMSLEERALYDDITSYLLEPGLYAFRGSQRQLLLIGFHRRMASSIEALIASLRNVAERLQALLDDKERALAGTATQIEEDLADDELAWDEEETAPIATAERIAIEAELARVESFIARATALPTDSKALALVDAVKLVREQAQTGKSSGKLVIFTEYLATQDYLARLLVENRVPEEQITLFRGDNDSARARAALDRWLAEVGNDISAEHRPSLDVATRLALVHEFRTRSQIFIATEAGAKGLNLQFCDTVVNYDLPWNPQRIEQRIGRCHRYGQRRDVTVVNFLASDNEAQRLTYEILEQKLELFGSVLGATDDVLRDGKLAPGAIASLVGNELETRLRQIYDRSRTLEEVERELRELRDAIGARKKEIEAAQARTEEVIQRRFDSHVRQAFKRIQEELPGELAAFDRDVLRVVTAYLEAAKIEHERDGATLVVDGVKHTIGVGPADTPPSSLHLGHPLVVAAVEHARAAVRDERFTIRCRSQDRALRGKRGRLQLHRIAYHGFEATDRVVAVVVLDPVAGPLDPALARGLLDGELTDVESKIDASHVSDAAMADALDEVLFLETRAAGEAEQARFERTIDQVERFLADRVMLLERQREGAVERLARAEVSRDAAVGAEQRDRAEAALRRTQDEIDGLDAQLDRLRAGHDEGYRRWRAHAQERRYARPEVERLLEAVIEVV